MLKGEQFTPNEIKTLLNGLEETWFPNELDYEKMLRTPEMQKAIAEKGTTLEELLEKWRRILNGI
jgi:hypothetical protein